MIAKPLSATMFAATLFALTLQPSSARDIDVSGHFTLITSCTEIGAKPSETAVVEIYVPSGFSGVGDGAYDELSKKLKQTKQGFYALDLTNFGKGKSLEPVLLKVSEDVEGLLVDQYTRGLPLRFVPRGGGIVRFDTRFAQELECTPLFEGRLRTANCEMLFYKP